MAEQLFVGVGEMRALLRSHDWSQTQLGSVETWSDDLKTAVQVLLAELAQAKLLKQPLNFDLPPGDIAAIVLQETAQAHEFRVKLTEALRPLTDPIEIQAIAARILGESLGANRVIYTEVVSNGEEVIVHKNYTNGVAQLSGRYRLEDYRRNLSKDHQTGQTQVVTDIPHNPSYTDAEQARYCAIGIAAHIDVPLIKNNRFVALLAVHQATPRQWTEAEVKQVEETAERTWAAVERARAEADRNRSEALLQASHDTFRHLVENSPFGVYVVDADFRLAQVSAGAQKVFENVRPLIGRDFAEVLRAIWPEPFASEAIALFQHTLETGEPYHAPNTIERRRDVSEVESYDWKIERITLPDGRFGVVCHFYDLSERQRYETALQESEEQSRYILESITDAFFAVDQNWCFTYVNQVAEGLLNRPQGDLIGKVLWEEYPGLAGSEFERIYWGAMRDRVAGLVTAFYPDHDRWYEAHTYPAVNGITIYFRNVTDRIQAETALRQSEERYRTLFNSIDEGFCVVEVIVDPNNRPIDYRLLEINPVFEQQTGIQQAVGKTARQLNLENHWIEIYGRVALTGEPIRFESSSDVLGRWFDVYACRTGQPEERKVAIVFRDISDRKQVEAALHEGANRLQLALASAKLGTWDFNPTTGILQWDDQCKAMFGLLPAAAVNYDVFLAGLHPDDREQTDQVVQFALNPESGGEYDIEYRTIGIEDGIERWVAAKGKAFFNSAGIAVRFIGTVLDMTEQKQVEAQRERLLQQEQAAREAAETANRIKDEFLAVLSHELRTPLNPILGWSKLLQQGKLDATKTTTALATIERNAQLQAQLIDDLLDISRILQGKLSLEQTSVDLRMVIASALETVRLAAETKSLHIETVVPADIRTVTGDAGRLQQVVWNLLSNAVKFTPSAGQITVALTQTDTHVQIQVIDTGKGINPEFLPYVFEHFRQEDGATTRKFGGLGLGLAIARQIVELHGGQISVASSGEDQGATFTVRLPLLESQGIGELGRETNTLLPPHPLTGLQVLVVDDEPDSREIVVFVLKQAGANVTSVASGIEALQAVERFTPQLIVSDIGMPEMDGYMLLQQMRAIEATRHIPAIALTAYAGEVDYRQALAAGFQRHVTKPIDPEVLVRAIVSLDLHN